MTCPERGRGGRGAGHNGGSVRFGRGANTITAHSLHGLILL